MTIVANSGPAIQFGITTTSTGGVQQYNEDRGPSMSDLGSGMVDPRPFYNYKPGAATSFTPSTVGFSQYQTAGFLNNNASVDFVPSAISSNGLVSNGSSGLGGSVLTLTSTGSGLTATTITAPETGGSVSVIAIDSTAAYVQFGQSGQIVMWNPAAGAGRNITIAMSSNLDGGSFTVLGRDIYGFKMSETLAAGSTTIAGKKAFKYIASIQASTTLTSTGFLIGYGDTYGFPAALNYVGQNAFISISTSPFNYATGSIVLTSATVVLASTTATQTSTTPDVRGTFTSSVGSNGTVRLQITQTFTPAILAGISVATTSAIFGAPQFSSV